MNPTEEAMKIAQRSTHKRYMMGCVIVRNNEILGKGHQHTGTWRMRELYSMHAELHALFNLRHMRGELGGSLAYIVGIARKSGNFVPALPCVRCATALVHAGIVTVAVSNGRIGTLSTRGNKPSMDTVYLPEVLDVLKLYPVP